MALGRAIPLSMLVAAQLAWVRDPRGVGGLEIAEPPRVVDWSIVGTLVLAPLVLAYTAEVFYQVWLQARFLEAMPPDVRAGFPPHPRRALLSFFASLRFQFAVLRYARLDRPDDAPLTTYWKRRMRASMVRELILQACLAVSAGVLLWLGWRPI